MNMKQIFKEEVSIENLKILGFITNIEYIGNNIVYNHVQRKHN